MKAIAFDMSQAHAAAALCADVAHECTSIDSPDFVRNVHECAAELPLSLREFIADFRSDSSQHGYAVVSGFPIDSNHIGPTPTQWGAGGMPRNAGEQDVYLMMCASLLGEPFGWATQQEGRLIHEVFPIAAHRHRQIGWSSDESLWWHTEDAFHSCRPDYVCILCLRNPTQTPTTIGELDIGLLSEEHLDKLFTHDYRIRADDSHSASLWSDDRWSEAERRKLEEAYQRRLEAGTIAVNRVLSGARSSPDICIDHYFMDLDGVSEDAREALRAMIDAIEENLVDVVLQPGDLLLLDNRKAVHGRRSFTARFDGTDRWLKRVNVTRDLRKSRPHRLDDTSRVIF